MRTLSFLLVCFLGASQPSARLKIDLVFDGVRLPQRLIAAAMFETTDIWRPYGVDVRAVTRIEARRPDAISLAVTTVDRPDDGLPVHALGSIQFVNNAPTSTIELYPRAIDDLMERSALSRGEIAWPSALHERILGRAVGRALAHELGHYLLRSQRHSSGGLMRARQMIDDLTNEERRCCVLSREDEARLGELLDPPRAAASFGGTRQ